MLYVSTVFPETLDYSFEVQLFLKKSGYREFGLQQQQKYLIRNSGYQQDTVLYQIYKHSTLENLFFNLISAVQYIIYQQIIAVSSNKLRFHKTQSFKKKMKYQHRNLKLDDESMKGCHFVQLFQIYLSSIISKQVALLDF